MKQYKHYILLPGELCMDFEWHKKPIGWFRILAWLIQEPVQQVAPLACGWMWKILEVTVDWSHLFLPTEQGQEFLLQILN